MSSVKNFTIAVTPRHRNWRTRGPNGEVTVRKMSPAERRSWERQRTVILRELNRTPWERS